MSPMGIYSVTFVPGLSGFIATAPVTIGGSIYVFGLVAEGMISGPCLPVVGMKNSLSIWPASVFISVFPAAVSRSAACVLCVAEVEKGEQMTERDALIDHFARLKGRRKKILSGGWSFEVLFFGRERALENLGKEISRLRNLIKGAADEDEKDAYNRD